MSFGGNQSRSDQRQSNVATSFVAPIQEQFLANMFRSASNYTQPGYGAQLGQAAAADSIPALQSALWGTSSLANPQAQIAAQSASLQSGLGQLFREEINPAITSRAIAAGGLGGGRQGVAQGVAAGQLGQAYTQGLGDIVANANRTALGAASATPALADARFRAGIQTAGGGLDQLARLAAILGSPAILSSAEMRSSTKQRSSGFGFGIPLGGD